MHPTVLDIKKALSDHTITHVLLDMDGTETMWLAETKGEMRPNVTLNAGLRYELQLPFQPEAIGTWIAYESDQLGYESVCMIELATGALRRVALHGQSPAWCPVP
jgi:Tol biopolymer transport system component